MYVAFIWPNCEYRGGDKTGDPIDAYFVGFTPEEVARHLPGVEYVEEDLSPTEFLGKNTGVMGGRLWYLVGKDLSFRVRCHWCYPIDTQWNGDSPFVHLGDVQVSDLDELGRLPPLPKPTFEAVPVVLIRVRCCHPANHRNVLIPVAVGLEADGIVPVMSGPSGPDGWAACFTPESADRVKCLLREIGAEEVSHR
jgi:hypothetical protein